MKEIPILYMLIEYEDNSHTTYEIANLNDLSKCIKDNEAKLIKIGQIERYLADFLETNSLADSRKAWDD